MTSRPGEQSLVQEWKPERFKQRRVGLVSQTPPLLVFESQAALSNLESLLYQFRSHSSCGSFRKRITKQGLWVAPGALGGAAAFAL